MMAQTHFCQKAITGLDLALFDCKNFKGLLLHVSGSGLDRGRCDYTGSNN